MLRYRKGQTEMIKTTGPWEIMSRRENAKLEVARENLFLNEKFSISMIGILYPFHVRHLEKQRLTEARKSPDSLQ